MSRTSGTFTFLFTDIEGSTRLWESDAPAMESALARHDDLLKAVIEQHQGSVFKTIGDAFCAVFPLAENAVTAALAAQQGLRLLDSPLPSGLRVRMAIHTGVASPRDEDYFGPCLNLVARLLAAAHGGQTLVSDATTHLVTTLPDGASMHDMGTHQLKDVSQPQRLFQLTHPDLPAEFPPLRTLAPAIHNLPLQLSSFIGREQALEDLEQALASSRLVTVVGVAGTGKTRIAVQAGTRAAQRYGDGVTFVGLASLTDGSLVPQAIASALRVREDPRVTPMQTLIESLRPRHVLLLLDNCEHLIEEVARICETLLQNCPRLSVIATSRELLGIPGEVTCPVSPLSLPPPSRRQTPEDRVRTLSNSEAVRLFVERAQAVSATFVLSAGNAEAVADVCRRLDGIPLAIELASARIKVLPVEQIDARLNDRFRLLTGGSRTALPRQQTLRAALDWSYDLLTEAERLLLQRVAVFQGGWTLEAAESVCSDEDLPSGDILELLGRLVDKSLARFRDEEQESRYDLLETLLAYGRERLRETGAQDQAQERHARFFTRYAERTARDLSGPDQAAAMDQLEREHDNLRAVLDRCATQPDCAVEGMRLGTLLWPFWAGRGHIIEGRARLAALLARDASPSIPRADALVSAAALARLQGDLRAACALFEEGLTVSESLNHDEARAWAMTGLGSVARDRGDTRTARDWYERSLALHGTLQNRRGEAVTLNGMGILEWRQGRYSDAQAWLRQSLAAYRSLDDPRGMAETLNNLGILAHSQGDLAAAQGDYHESHALQEMLGDRRGTADTLHNLGVLALALGDPEEAKRLQEESLSRSREAGDSRAVAAAINSLADVALAQSDYELAGTLYRDCLRAYRAVEQTHNTAYALEGLAFVAEHDDQWERAARLIGAAHALRGATANPLDANDAARLAALTDQARRALTDAFDALHDEGARWPSDDAAQYALSEVH